MTKWRLWGVDDGVDRRHNQIHGRYNPLGSSAKGCLWKAKLLVHLLSSGACTRNATSYRFEVCDNPQEREQMLLQAYKTSYYRLPRCNVMMG